MKNYPVSLTLRAISIAFLSTLLGCASGQQPVIETLDERTAVTITHHRTPLILSPDVHYSNPSAREFVQMGAIEINRMGTRQYFLWLGIWDIDHAESDDDHPNGYDSVNLLLDGERVVLNVLGWTPEIIGASERTYKKIFPEDVDAYYRITLEQLSSLSDATDIKLHTTSLQSKEFVPWYNQEKADADLAAFIDRVVL